MILHCMTPYYTKLLYYTILYGTMLYYVTFFVIHDVCGLNNLVYCTLYQCIIEILCCMLRIIMYYMLGFN